MRQLDNDQFEIVLVCLSFNFFVRDMFLRRLFSEAVAAVQPRDLVRASLRVVGNELRIEDAAKVASHDLSGGGRVFVVGFGKGVLPLAAEVESVLGATRISRGILSVPRGFPATALASDTRCGFALRGICVTVERPILQNY